MNNKLYIKKRNGEFEDVTSKILTSSNITDLDYIIKKYNRIEYAYIRTETLDKINELIDVSTSFEGETININKMFYKKYNETTKEYNVPFDASFIDANRFNVAEADKTIDDKLFDKFQNDNFIISAIYHENDDNSETIDNYTWTSVPLGTNSTYKYEWQIMRTSEIVTSIDGNIHKEMWNYFTYPILINKFNDNYIGNDNASIHIDDKLCIRIDENYYDASVDSNGNLIFEKLITVQNG